MNMTARVTTAALAFALTGGVLATPAWAAEGWLLPPGDVSTSTADLWSSPAATAAGDDGSLMTMWAEWGASGELMARLWSDGAWAASPVSVTGDAPELGDFFLASRGGGSYVAVWTFNEENGDGTPFMTLRSSVFEAGSWAAPVILATSELDEEFDDIGLAAAPDGTVLVAWSHMNTVTAITRTGSTWASTLDLGLGGNVQVAAAADGSAAVSWGADVGGVSNVAAARVFDGATWTDTAFLSEESGFAPILAASPTGFVAMWMAGNDRLPRAATYSASGWSDTHILRETNEIGGGLTSPGQIVSTPDGTVVTWNDGGFGSTAVWTAMFDGTSWSPSMRLLDATEQAVDHIVAGAANGSFMIVWQGNGGGELTARPFTDTTVGEAVELSATTNGLNPRLVAGSNGYFVVTWVDSGTVFARLFDGLQWSEAEALDEYAGSPFAAVTSQNRFFAGWEWYGQSSDRSVIRMTSLGTPEGPGGGGDNGSGDDQLATTGSAPFAGTAAIAGALVLLLGAALVGLGRRSSAGTTTR